VEEIWGDAFAHCCKLTSVIIPNSVTTICSNAFGGCESLSSIVIPDSVKQIHGHAFPSSLKTITIKNEKLLKNVGLPWSVKIIKT